MLAPAGGSPETTATDVDSTWYFCPALDAFQVELGADMRDAFLSPSKQVVPLHSDAVLPVLQVAPPSVPSSEKPRDASAPSTTLHDNNCRPDRRPSSSSSDDSGMADDDDDDGVDELSTSTGEPQTTGRWTKKEHELFLEGLRRYGKSWKSISNLVVTRTLVQIRTHAQKYLQKQSRSAKAAFPFASGATHPSRHPHHLPFHPHALHLAAMQHPPAFLMHQPHLRWGLAHDPAAVAYQQDAIYRQLMQQQHRQHVHTTDNNALDQLLDHSDDESDDPDNNGKSDDDDDDELQHMMMECETNGKRRSSAPAMSQSSALKHLAPSPDVTRSLKRRRVDAMHHKHAAMAYLDPAVTYGKPTPSHALSSLSFTHQPTQQHLGAPFGSVLRSPQLI